ncbi:thioesterase family protein [Egibacter rhizosphaerae]|uniref:Thioesterase family protein n=1 Tax=Egibacter rhizosphaerae TaxID=1670831 RepID=A0A411YG52_9ACTN|nr:thioesterase family protein [Egibacter rhizosphaerae]QBI20159.1 thioesterase family protein [Egibacter rhizosphaerae]
MASGPGGELDVDTVLERGRPGVHHGVASERWSVGPALNGGYGLVLALRAIAAEVPAPDPLTVTGHFLSGLVPGPVEIAVAVHREGRRAAVATAAIRQEGEARVRAIARFGELPAAPDPQYLDVAPPSLPPPDACVGREPGAGNPLGIALLERVDWRVDPTARGWMIDGIPNGRPRQVGWLRFADGRPNDLLGLACLVDGIAPTVMELGIGGWVPTLELTVHLRAHPAAGWLRCALASHVVQGGLTDETCELWDGDGRFVAAARQLARLP